MKLHHNNYNTSLQRALFKAAKIGNINLVRAFIKAGANPFIHDVKEWNALSYAIAANPKEAAVLVAELDKAFEREVNKEVEASYE